jgi:hypothetical protein
MDIASHPPKPLFLLHERSSAAHCRSTRTMLCAPALTERFALSILEGTFSDPHLSRSGGRNGDAGKEIAERRRAIQDKDADLARIQVTRRDRLERRGCGWKSRPPAPEANEVRGGMKVRCLARVKLREESPAVVPKIRAGTGGRAVAREKKPRAAIDLRPRSMGASEIKKRADVSIAFGRPLPPCGRKQRSAMLARRTRRSGRPPPSRNAWRCRAP